MVTMRLKYDVSILVCHVRCPSLPSCSVVNDSSPLVYYWSTSCMDDLCCVFPVYSNVVLWLAVCPRTFLILAYEAVWYFAFLSSYWCCFAQQSLLAADHDVSVVSCMYGCLVTCSMSLSVHISFLVVTMLITESVISVTSFGTYLSRHVNSVFVTYICVWW